MVITLDDTTTIVMLMASFGLLMFFVLLFYDMKDAKKAIIWYFESDKIVKQMASSVKDGMVQIHKKLFFVDKNIPPSMATGLIVKSQRPVYVFKHNQPVPMSVTEKGIKAEHSPENLKNFRENKTLEALLTVKSEGMSLIWIAVGLVIGALLMYVLITSGAITMPK